MSNVMKSCTILLYPTWDMSHPYVGGKEGAGRVSWNVSPAEKSVGGDY